MKRKICVITTSRAEYGLLYWLMKEIRHDSELVLQLIVSGSHLSAKHGLTHRLIEEDGFDINCRVDISLGDTRFETVVSMSEALKGFYAAYDELKPDLIVLLGDRYEVFAAAVAATIARLPIAHIHGGESTEGAFDESFRHSITKMSLLHFTAAEDYRQRVIQLGESPDRVFCFGTPGLEYIERTELMSKKEIEAFVGFKFKKPTFLVTYHPITLEQKTSLEQVESLMMALKSFPEANVIFTQANADPDNAVIRKRIDDFVTANPKRMRVFESLGHRRYLSVLKYVDVIIGNSSSGIIEVPALYKPTVNIGDRQKGRLMASSVICCSNSKTSISEAISTVLTDIFQKGLPFVVNPYKSGEKVSANIKNVLKNVSLNKGILKKQFYDLHGNGYVTKTSRS